MNAPATDAIATDPAPEPRIVWSADEERFSADSLDELLGEDHGFEVGSIVYFGEAAIPDPATWMDADDVIEQLASRAFDQCGEWADDYPTVSKEAKEELQVLLEQWASKYATPNFYTVKSVKEYELTAEDLKSVEGT